VRSKKESKEIKKKLRGRRDAQPENTKISPGPIVYFEMMETAVNFTKLG